MEMNLLVYIAALAYAMVVYLDMRMDAMSPLGSSFSWRAPRLNEWASALHS